MVQKAPIGKLGKLLVAPELGYPTSFGFKVIRCVPIVGDAQSATDQTQRDVIAPGGRPT